MNVIRSIFAAIAGYLVFAMPAFIFFQTIYGRPAHQPAPLSIIAASIAFSIPLAILGGYVAARLAASHPLAHGIAVAAIVAAGAVVSLVGTLGKGSVWSQVVALAVMAPCAALGGWLRARSAPDF